MYCVVIIPLVLFVGCAIKVSCTKPILGCDDEWVRHRNKCYRMYEHRVTFTMAIDVCAKQYFGQLATVNSKEEQYFIRDHYFKEGGVADQSVWIAGVRVSYNTNDKDNFYWIGGDRMNFTAWEDGEPNNNYDIEYCVAMAGTGDKPELWFDSRCDSTYWALCQRNLVANKEYSDKLMLILSTESEKLEKKVFKVWAEVERKNVAVFFCCITSLVLLIVVTIFYLNGSYDNARSFFVSKYSSLFSRFQNEIDPSSRRSQNRN